MSSPKSKMTAIARKTVSRPMKDLLNEGRLVAPVLDFGSGRGTDVKMLEGVGLNISGYDPNWANIDYDESAQYRTVTSNYVLNVVEPENRLGAVKRIFNKVVPGGTAIVSVRSDVEKAATGKWKKYKDGYITSIGTFQADIGEEALVNLMKDAGFKNVEIVSRSGYSQVIGKKEE